MVVTLFMLYFQKFKNFHLFLILTFIYKLNLTKLVTYFSLKMYLILKMLLQNYQRYNHYEII